MAASPDVDAQLGGLLLADAVSSGDGDVLSPSICGIRPGFARSARWSSAGAHADHRERTRSNPRPAFWKLLFTCEHLSLTILDSLGFRTSRHLRRGLAGLIPRFWRFTSSVPGDVLVASASWSLLGNGTVVTDHIHGRRMELSHGRGPRGSGRRWCGPCHGTCRERQVSHARHGGGVVHLLSLDLVFARLAVVTDSARLSRSACAGAMPSVKSLA